MRAAGAGRAWAELLRVSALFTVPGDALAGAAAAGRTPNRGTALAVGTSLCLYEAGMVLNDWADRETDARERPGRPLPSGRIRPGAALAAACALTGTGLMLAAKAGRRTLAEATALAATVWAYDLGLKHTPAAAPAMAAARALDLHLGATATRAAADRAAVPSGAERLGPAAVSAAGPRGNGASRRALGRLLVRPGRPGTGPHGRSTPLPAGLAAGPNRNRVSDRTGVLTSGQAPIRSRPGASRREQADALTGPTGAGDMPSGHAKPARATALGAAALVGAHTLAVTGVSRREAEGGSSRAPLAALAVVGAVAAAARQPGRPVHQALAAGYALAAARPLLHAALNPSPPLVQRAVGGGIRAMIPLQAALAARAGSVRTAATLLALLPVARRLSRKVSPT